MTEDQAIKTRSLLERLLTKDYEQKLVDYQGGWAIIYTIGVEWIGGDGFEVIMNLDGVRTVLPYEVFLTEVKLTR